MKELQGAQLEQLAALEGKDESYVSVPNGPWLEFLH
jgi:hypothetical protein